MERDLQAGMEELDTQIRTRVEWERVKVWLEAEYEEERRINEELDTKTKGLEHEAANLLDEKMQLFGLEEELARVRYDAEVFQRKFQICKEELDCKEKERSLLQERNESLQRQVTELSEQVARLGITKQDLRKANRILHTEILRRTQQKGTPKSAPRPPQFLQNKF